MASSFCTLLPLTLLVVTTMKIRFCIRLTLDTVSVLSMIGISGQPLKLRSTASPVLTTLAEALVAEVLSTGCVGLEVVVPTMMLGRLLEILAGAGMVCFHTSKR